MKLKQLKINNFKSLRNLCFIPSDFTAIVGANASGKTNFSKALKFLAEVYEIGLERAILNAGGYDNIALRKERRSKSPIKFEVVLESEKNERFKSRLLKPIRNHKSVKFEILHTFSFTATSGEIKAEFKVVFEEIKIFSIDNSENKELVLQLIRQKNGEVEIKKIAEDVEKEFEKSPLFQRVKSEIGPNNIQQALFDYTEDTLSEQDLIILELPFGINYLIRYSYFGDIISNLVTSISRFKIFQLSPLLARESSPPIPNPYLASTGENLPTLVDRLERNSPEQWESILEIMKEILPSLKDISTDYIYTRELALFFEEEGVGRPWRAEEVSDGTILALALLVAAFESRSTLIMFDEIENSLHPWILRTIIENLKKVSEIKNVIITTHSPILVDLLNPSEIWLIYRKNRESHMKKLTDIDPDIENEWKDGKYQLSTQLDSGYIGQYVPGGVF